MTAKTNAKTQAAQQPKLDPIEQLNQSLDLFGIEDKDNFKPAWYALQDRLGYLLSQQSKAREEQFDWQDFKEVFAQVFGTPEQPKVSLDILVQFAIRKVGLGLDGLIAENKKSFQRREQRQLQRAYELVERDRGQQFQQPQVRTQYPTPVPRQQPVPAMNAVVVDDVAYYDHDSIPY